jgi:hypothetical protein
MVKLNIIKITLLISRAARTLIAAPRECPVTTIYAVGWADVNDLAQLIIEAYIPT